MVCVIVQVTVQVMFSHARGLATCNRARSVQYPVCRVAEHFNLITWRAGGNTVCYDRINEH